MVFDFTTQLQPALWGMVLALLVSASALVAVADRRELDWPWRQEPLRDQWRWRWRFTRAALDRALARLAAAVGRLTDQLAPRARHKA